MSSLQESQQTGQQGTVQNEQPNLLQTEITDENVALNVMVLFLNLAQNRGAFRIDESAKIFECIKMFQKGQPPVQQPAQPPVQQSTEKNIKTN